MKYKITHRNINYQFHAYLMYNCNDCVRLSPCILSPSDNQQLHIGRINAPFFSCLNLPSCQAAVSWKGAQQLMKVWTPPGIGI
jgi:hypothetical protein